MTDLNLGKQSEFWPLGIQVAGMFSYFQAPSPLWDDTDTHFLYSNLSPNYKLTFTGQKNNHRNWYAGLAQWSAHNIVKHSCRVFLSWKLLPWTSGPDNSPISHLSEAISSALDEVLVTAIAAGDQEEEAALLLSWSHIHPLSGVSSSNPLTEQAAQAFMHERKLQFDENCILVSTSTLSGSVLPRVSR